MKTKTLVFTQMTEDEILKHIASNTTEFIGLGKGEFAKKLGSKSAINKSCKLWKVIERLNEINLHFEKSSENSNKLNLSFINNPVQEIVHIVEPEIKDEIPNEETFNEANKTEEVQEIGMILNTSNEEFTVEHNNDNIMVHKLLNTFAISVKDLAKILNLTERALTNRVSRKLMNFKYYGYYKRVNKMGKASLLLYIYKENTSNIADELIEKLFSNSETTEIDAYKLKVLLFIEKFIEYLKEHATDKKEVKNTEPISIVEPIDNSEDSKDIEVQQPFELYEVNQPADILSQTENNFMRLGEALSDMINIMAGMFSQVHELRHENEIKAKILYEKEKKIEDIEYRLNASNQAISTWLQRYEEMKARFFDRG